MMSDEEFDRLGRRHRLTPEEEQRWMEELWARCTFERMGWRHEKIRRRGFNLRETNDEPRETRRHNLRAAGQNRHLYD
jgi:hypothetical protein